jgi:phosphoglycerate kinase
MDKATVRDVQISGSTVLLRVDFNVPIEDGLIDDDTRIRAAQPTIEYLAQKGNRVVLCAHLGRPDGEVVPTLSLQPCADRLGKLLGKPVGFVSDCIGEEVEEAVGKMQPSEIILLENTRFHCAEDSKNEAEMLAFAEQLAAPAEAYVNDAFGACHRNHASTYGVTKYLDPCVAGLLVEEEISQLTRILEAPQEGFVVVLGGAKVEDKIGVIKKLLPKCETMLIGGAMSWAFFKANGMEVGASLCKPESVAAATEILQTMSENDLSKMMLPTDVHMKDTANESATEFAPADGIKPGWDALDIGPQTQKRYADIIRQADNVFWNGPMGKFEDKPFDEGTLAVALAMGKCPGFNVVGGGDSVAAVTLMGVADAIDHISTGGGASLEFLEDGSLSAIAALDDK